MAQQRTTWDEFADKRLLWFVNRILHAFGWTIVLVIDDKTQKCVEAYPARVSYIGFEPEVVEAGRREFLEGLDPARFANPTDS